MAKDLVRTKQYVKKFMVMKANIQAVSLKITTLKSQDSMMQAMKGVSQVMKKMNKQMNMPQIQKIMMEFERQSEMMDMKSEMMEDAIDDVMEGDDEEEESDAIVRQVFDELGIQLSEELGGLPEGAALAGPSQAKNRPAAVPAGGTDSADADLEARLNNLRRD